jgi:hypothetical protein
MPHSVNLQSLFDDDTTLDVRFEGDTATLIRHKHWTAAEIEEQVSQFSYSGENLPKDPEVEKAKLPPFALAFYKFIFFKGRLPNEQELWSYYLGQHFTEVDEVHIQFLRKGRAYKYLVESIKARMLRSYPSLIRDFHFFVLCQESRLFEHVSYSLRDDYFNGIDLIISYQNKLFRVSVMLNSERARAYKAQKYARHTEVVENEVLMLFDLYTNANVKGQIKLFSAKHVKELLTELQKHAE